MNIHRLRARWGLVAVAVVVVLALAGCSGGNPSAEAGQTPAAAPAQPTALPGPGATPSQAPTQAGAPGGKADVPDPGIKTTHPDTVRVVVTQAEVEAACHGRSITNFWMSSTDRDYTSNELRYSVSDHSVKFDGRGETVLQFLSVTLTGASGPVDFKVTKPVTSGTWRFTSPGDGSIMSVALFACLPDTA